MDNVAGTIVQFPTADPSATSSAGNLQSHAYLDAGGCVHGMDLRQWFVVEKTNKIKLWSAGAGVRKSVSKLTDSKLGDHMTEIFRFFVVIILLTISLSAYLLVIDALFPNRVTKTQRVINQMPGRALGIGLVNLLFFGVILIVLLTITDGNANRVNSVVRVILLIPTLLLAGLLTAVLSFGFAGMVRVLGERILSDLTTLKRSIAGTVILSVACALPFVGWFLLLPYTGLVGFGATILGFFQRDS